MNKKQKAIIVVGGTGGHVFPGCNLADHLIKQGYDIELVCDKRGNKYLEKFRNFKTSILPSSPIHTRNPLKFLFSAIIIVYSIIRCFIFLIFNKPSFIIGMGGYGSFPICAAASVLKIKFILYENNMIVGKANKYLFPFAHKILVSHKELDGISTKYRNKMVEIGNIINKDIIDFAEKNSKKIDKTKLNILVLGGSQAAKIFAEELPNIFKQCLKNGVPLKIFQQCLKNQNEKLKMLYQNTDIDFEIFNFSNKIVEYFSKVNLAITRSGSSMISELTNANIPFISVPLPSSADNHQLKNALYYQKKKLAFLVEEKNLKDQLPNLIIEIFNNGSVLDEIIQQQNQYSDKNVYKNIDHILKEITDEKN